MAELERIKREIDIIQATFRGNESLLKSIRALFLGLKISAGEKNIIKTTFANKELLKIFRDKFNPTLDRDAPIGQITDPYLGMEEMIFGAHPDKIAQAVGYKERALKKMGYALSLLEEPNQKGIVLDSNSSKDDPLQIALLTRVQYIKHIDKQLVFIWTIAEKDMLSDDEIQKRLEANSSK